MNYIEKLNIEFIEAIRPYTEALSRLNELKKPMVVMNYNTGKFDIIYNNPYEMELYIKGQIEIIRRKFNIPFDGLLPEKWEFKD